MTGQSVSLPSVREPDPLIRREVTSADIDLNGHMNVAHYFNAHVAAVRDALAGVGVTEEYVAERRLGTFAAEHHLRYLGELKEGDVFTMRVQILDRSEKAIHLRSLLATAGSGAVASVLEVITVHVDLTTRRATPIPEDVTDRIDTAIRSVDKREHDLPMRLTLHRAGRSTR